MVRFYLIFLLIQGWTVLCGNNIQFANLIVEYEDGNPGSALLTFDLSWENSWRTTADPANWDAAWVFAKYRTQGDTVWHHILLSSPPAAPTGAVIDVLDNTGAMIYATASKSGNASYQQTQLRWNLTANGLENIEGLDFRVFGVEMVYVPAGKFKLGGMNTGTEVNMFHEIAPSWKRPAYSVISSDEIPVGNARGQFNFGVDNPISVPTTIPAAFPKGFRAFYAMKYELSQQQYVDFFNTLTPSQKALRDITGSTGKDTDEVLNRNAISYDDLAGGDATTTAPHVPVGYVSISDMLAYLDWSGLRPMTEMEFEKLCRGPNGPIFGEYAWGTDKIANWEFTPTLLNGSGESLVNLNIITFDAGNAGYSATTKLTTSGTGPLRSGIYSASLTLGSTRVLSGAGYYGHMELSGNQAEGVISVSHTDGTAFENIHGNGHLPANGYADVLTWPQSQHGVGTRGGHYNSSANHLRVADRSTVVITDDTPDVRYAWLQFRGVRGL
ncbi:formylglycine-generating enzyme required for sulfatase activity [Lewinella aquimaris]|uniref:Formylglycine-generating enzyme required for sulfatase activity n=1 Tax=Neolewinella aquimaris TaxID=1835722 RepID=A0A840E7T7_9BACT|nr:SUMF1/EgtB/PvdO family nonheme iron enzyme [Neolewinella aquimaris]MBB4079792.1 formylglycine-generating enzyme required for sulfatase activity [Neolewinella aquimaris]